MHEECRDDFSGLCRDFCGFDARSPAALDFVVFARLRFPNPCSVAINSWSSLLDFSEEVSAIPITESVFFKRIPRTPAAARPIARTSASLNRIACPARVMRMI